MEDSVAYLRSAGPYKEIIVFVYDESASAQEHDITAAAMRELDTISDVVIVSRPSRQPAPDQRQHKAQKKRAIVARARSARREALPSCHDRPQLQATASCQTATHVTIVSRARLSEINSGDSVTSSHLRPIRTRRRRRR
jgi:hypothetical protein